MERKLKTQLAKLWSLEDEDKNPQEVKLMVKEVLKDTMLLINHLEQLKDDVCEILANWEKYQTFDIVNLAECYTQIDDYEELENDYIVTEINKEMSKSGKEKI